MHNSDVSLNFSPFYFTVIRIWIEYSDEYYSQEFLDMKDMKWCHTEISALLGFMLSDKDPMIIRNDYKLIQSIV